MPWCLKEVRLKPRKVVHHKLVAERYTLSFRGGVLGTVDRIKVKGRLAYVFYPIYEAILGDAGHIMGRTMKSLKEEVLAIIPPDPPPAPGMPVVDA